MSSQRAEFYKNPVFIAIIISAMIMMVLGIVVVSTRLEDKLRDSENEGDAPQEHINARRAEIIISEASEEEVEDIMQVLLVNLVRHQDQFGIRVLLDVSRQQFFILRPCATRYDDAGTSLCEGMDEPQARVGISLLSNQAGYLTHAVEARVAGYGGILDAMSSKQLQGLLVLHEDMREAFQ